MYTTSKVSKIAELTDTVNVANWIDGCVSVEVNLIVFFFRQQTAYDVMPSLVSSEMWYKRQYRL